MLSWSYHALSPAAARLFRLLSLHPAPTATAAEFSALSGDDPRPALAELTRAHLLQETAADRYTCHDLLREYAADRAELSETPAERRSALGRLLAHAVAGDADLALRVPLVQRAAAAGFTAEAAALVRTVETPLRLLGRWEELAAAAGAVAELPVEPEVEARMRVALAEACFKLDDHRVALDTHDGVERYNAVGWILAMEGRHEDALRLYFEALAAADERQDRHGRAVTLHNIGDAHLAIGRHHEAITAFQEGLAVCRAIGDLDGECVLLKRLAAAYDAAGHRRRARRARSDAAALQRRR